MDYAASWTSKQETSSESPQVANHGRWRDPDVINTLRKGLQARQLTMVPLGVTIGTGLLVGSGSGIHTGGPLGLLLAYALISFVAHSVVTGLAEMAAFMSHHRGLAGYVSQYWNPAIGFAVGWNYALQFWMLSPVQINNAGTALLSINSDVPIAVWMLLVIAIVTIVNLLPVRYFGEFEFWFSTFKIVCIVGLLLFGIIFNAGGVPLADGRRDHIGFRYWKSGEGPFAIIDNENPDLSRFMAICSLFVNVLFAYAGIEMIGVAAGEAVDPKRAIPAAAKRVFWIVCTIYMVGVFIIGLIIPSRSTSPDYIDLTTRLAPNGSDTSYPFSPFVIAVTRLGNATLGHVFSAIVFTFALSTASINAYVSSRTLFALAIEGKAPAIFKYVTKWGVPINSLALSIVWMLLAFLNVRLGVGEVFDNFSRLSTSFTAITWVCISITYIRFKKAVQVQKLEYTLPWTAPLQPYSSYFSALIVFVLLLLKGFDTFVPFRAGRFVISYVGILIFVACYLFWKWKQHNASTIPPEKVDLSDGLQSEEEEFNI